MKNIGEKGERKDVPESQLFIGGKNFLCFLHLSLQNFPFATRKCWPLRHMTEEITDDLGILCN